MENKFMKEAVNEARKGMNENERGPFGAVIVKDGKIISRAHNKVLSRNDPTAHAEMEVIRKASNLLGRFDLSDCEIYSSCEPCPMCLSAIMWAKIKKVYFGCTKKDAENIGFDDKKIYDFFKNPRNDSLVLEKLDRISCMSLFDQWQKKSDKKQY